MMNNRLNFPDSYIGYVKSWPKFKNTELLKNFPKNGIILHDTNLEVHLSRLGIDQKNITRIRIGTSMPGAILLVEPTKKYPRFFIAHGLPGGSGVSTLTAELYALGADNIVHIGLCAILGTELPSGIPLLALGANKDNVATLLSDNEDSGLLAFPSKPLNSSLLKTFKKLKIPLDSAYGYTTPVFYFQSKKLVKDLILGKTTADGEIINYIEMEQAALFQTAKLMKKNAASIVIGSDRYSILNGRVAHNFEDDFDQDELEKCVLKSILNNFSTPLPN